MKKEREKSNKTKDIRQQPDGDMYASVCVCVCYYILVGLIIINFFLKH